MWRRTIKIEGCRRENERNNGQGVSLKEGKERGRREGRRIKRRGRVGGQKRKCNEGKVKGEVLVGRGPGKRESQGEKEVRNKSEEMRNRW